MKIKVERMASLLFCTLCAFFLLYLFVRYLAPILLPFLFAYLCALATRGAAEKIHKKTGIGASCVRVFLLIFAVLLLSSLFFFLGFSLVGEAQALLIRWGNGTTGIEKALASLRASFHAFAERTEAGDMLENLLDSLLREGTASVFSLLSRTVQSTLFAIPRVCVFMLITLIAALYFALDLHRVSAFCAELCPQPYRARIMRFGKLLKNCLLRYMRAYALLATMTFCVLLIGFLCLRIRYAILLAVLLTLFDLLPVLGVGCALVPWGIFEIACGDGGRGFALLLLFAFIFCARQFLEPKIVGAQMGLHPLVSLFFTYAGFRLFGLAGMVLAPISAATAHKLLTDRRK